MCSTVAAIGEASAVAGSRAHAARRSRRQLSAWARAATAGDARWIGLFGVFATVAVVEIVQTVTAFFGNESLLWFHQDFPALYAAGKMVASGSGSLLYDTGALADAEIAAAGHPVGGTGVLAYFNPPFFAGMMAPLSAMSLDRAYQVWTLFSVALLAIDGWLLWRIASGLPRRSRIALLGGFATLYPVSYGLELGQFSLVLVTSWAAAYLLLRNERDATAGLALTPLLIKPELLLPVAGYLLWKRRWRVFPALAPVTAIAVAASIAIVGAHSALAYPAYLLDSTKWSGEGVASNVMFDWNGVAAMAWERPAASHAGLIVVMGLSISTLVWVARSWRGALDVRSPRFATQWLLLTVATVLVDPHLYLQDTVLVAPAAAALLAATCTHRRAVMGAAMLAGWVVLGLGIYPNEHLHINLFGLYLAASGVALLLGRKGAGVTCAACVPSHAVERELVFAAY